MLMLDIPDAPGTNAETASWKMGQIINPGGFKQETVCQEADRLVSTDRQNDYGHPLDDYTKVAAFGSVIFGIPITPEQAQMFMVAVKLSRQLNRPKRDNIVDAIGYLKCIDLTIEERARRASTPA